MRRSRLAVLAERAATEKPAAVPAPSAGAPTVVRRRGKPEQLMISVFEEDRGDQRARLLGVLAARPEVEWVTGGGIDRTGDAIYVHIIRGPNDPERQDIRALPTELRDRSAAWRRELKKSTVAEWEERILKHLFLGLYTAKTWNCIAVELLDKTADVLMCTPPERALWSLVERQFVEHTMKAPIHFRVTKETMVAALTGEILGDKPLPALAGAEVEMPEEPACAACEEPLTPPFTVCEACGTPVPAGGAEQTVDAASRIELSKAERCILQLCAVEGGRTYAAIKAGSHDIAANLLYAAFTNLLDTEQLLPCGKGSFRLAPSMAVRGDRVDLTIARNLVTEAKPRAELFTLIPREGPQGLLLEEARLAQGMQLDRITVTPSAEVFFSDAVERHRKSFDRVIFWASADDAIDREREYVVRCYELTAPKSKLVAALSDELAEERGFRVWATKKGATFAAPGASFRSRGLVMMTLWKAG